MYQVGIFQSKNYFGASDSTAAAEGRTRILSFKKQAAAEAEYEDQVERAQAVLEYAKRHSDTSHIYFSVKLLYDGADGGSPSELDSWNDSYNYEDE